MDNDSLRRGESGEQALRRDMTDLFVHAVDPDRNAIRDPEEVLKTVDRSYDHLSLYFDRAGVERIVPAAQDGGVTKVKKVSRKC